MPQVNSIDDIVNIINTKISSTKNIPSKDLFKAQGDQRFWIFNGPVLETIMDLRDALVAITDEQFNHHVTLEKNDFASWVENVILEPALAKKMRSYRTRKSIHKLVEVYLKKNYKI